jgi:hypothetical protein
MLETEGYAVESQSDYDHSLPFSSLLLFLPLTDNEIQFSLITNESSYAARASVFVFLMNPQIGRCKGNECAEYFF